MWPLSTGIKYFPSKKEEKGITLSLTCSPLHFLGIKLKSEYELNVLMWLRDQLHVFGGRSEFQLLNCSSGSYNQNSDRPFHSNMMISSLKYTNIRITELNMRTGGPVLKKYWKETSNEYKALHPVNVDKNKSSQDSLN